MTTNRFTLWLTLYFLLVLNIPLTLQLYKIISTTESDLAIGFIISLPLFFGALFYFLFSFVTVRWLLKPLSITLVLISSMVTYAMYSYGTLFDYSMMQNVFETNYGEASSYLSLSAAGSFLLIEVVPAALIARLLGSGPFKGQMSSTFSGQKQGQTQFLANLDKSNVLFRLISRWSISLLQLDMIIALRLIRLQMGSSAKTSHRLSNILICKLSRSVSVLNSPLFESLRD